MTSPPVTRPAAPGGARGPRLAEAQLCALWRGRRFPAAALVTRAGVAVTVIFQGRRGRGPGPDYRGAVIAGPSGVPVRGDVELHVRASDFRAHGHHLDAAYAGIVLHVVFEDDIGADTPLPGGGTAPVVALAPWVARRAGELEQWLQRPLLWREPCHDAVMRLGEDGVAAALEAEGRRRADARTARMRDAVAADGLEQALYAAFMQALGYGGNAAPMLALARLIPWQDAWRRARAAAEEHLELEALLLGGAGLLPSQRRHRGPVEDYALALEERFARSRAPSLPSGLWKLWGIRPENAPARRIAGAAALLLGSGGPLGLLECLEAGSVREAVAPLIATAPSPFWRGRHDLCAGPARMPVALIGRSRALEILLNVILPAGAASGEPRLEERAAHLLERLPRPSAYGATRFLEQALESEGVRVPLNALRSQGLLALNRDWCSQNGCGRCPLS
jgi:hypothetical protein